MPTAWCIRLKQSGWRTQPIFWGQVEPALKARKTRLQKPIAASRWNYLPFDSVHEKGEEWGPQCSEGSQARKKQQGMISSLSGKLLEPVGICENMEQEMSSWADDCWHFFQFKGVQDPNVQHAWLMKFMRYF